MESRTLRALKLAREVKLDIYNKRISPTNILRKCEHIAKLLGREKDLEWIRMELNGYPGQKIQELEKILPDYRKMWITYQDRYGQPMVFATSPEKLREIHETLMIHFESRGFHILVDNIEEGLFLAVDEEKRQIFNELYRSTVSFAPRAGDIVVRAVVPPATLREAVETVMERAHEFVSNVEIELEYSSTAENAFQQRKTYLDSKLGEFSPEALEKLTMAYQRLGEAQDVEQRAEVALRCRRILKTFADSVFPGRDEKYVDSEGKEHNVGEEEYINRLWAHLDQHARSETNRKLAKANVMNLGSFLDHLHELANKGLHGEFSHQDANRAVIYTYLLLGDIIEFTSHD